jgi:tRNA A-37 threonylcarbamoyl transferase component Bud32/WD40 repeat protein
MTHSLSQDVMKISDADATLPSSPPGHAETLLLPVMRPDVLAAPEHQRARQTVAAALFGADSEAVQLGRYRLLSRIGAGGMGIVYAAYDDRLDRKVALKLIRPSRLDGAEAAARTLREARALARLSHPNVVHVYEVGELEDRQVFVAMEFLAGPTLRAWLDVQPRPWPEVLAVFRQAAEGLAAAHAHGVVHRDFKPHNAIFGADGRVRVLDFGLAQLDGSGDARAAIDHAEAHDLTRTLTSTGSVIGTPAYMAPEQFAGRRGDARTDQFSFCVSFYEALYGSRPFTGETVAALAESVGSGRIAAPPKQPGVPEWLRVALLRGLQAEPAKRWASMAALLAALAGDPAARRRSRTRWTGASLGAAVALTSGAWWWGAALQREEAAQREALAQEVSSARADVDRQVDLGALVTAREQLPRSSTEALRTLAGLVGLDESGARTARTLALAALSRGLPDRVLTGPGADILHVRPAGDAVFAQDAGGGVWRWGAGEAVGRELHRLPAIASDLIVAPSGRAWVAVAPDGLVGGRLVGDAWETWRVEVARAGSHIISSDERWLMQHGFGPAVAWDLRTGAVVEDAFPERSPGGGELRTQVSPDGRWLAQGRFGTTEVTLWDRSSGRTRTLESPGIFQGFIGYSADGRALIGGTSSGGESRLIAWDLERGEAKVWREDASSASAFGPYFALEQTDRDGLVACVAEPLADGCVWQRPVGHNFDSLLASADGEGYALRTYSQEQHRRPLELGELATGGVLRRFHALAGGDGELDAAGNYLSSRGRLIDVWSARDRAHSIVDLRKHHPDLTHTPSPDGGVLVRHRKSDRSLARIDVRDGSVVPLESCVGADGPVRFAVDDGGRILASQGAGALHLYTAGSTTPRAIAGVSEPIREVFLGADGQGFAALSAAGTAYVWSGPEQPMRSFDVGAGGFPYLWFDPSGKRVASMSESGGVQLVDAGQRVQVLPPAKGSGNLEFSGDGRTLVALQLTGGALAVHDLASATTRPVPVALALRPQSYFGLAVAHDGGMVAVSDTERLFLVDPVSGSQRQVDAGGAIWSLRFDPAGDRLFAAVGDAIQAFDLTDLSATPLWTTHGRARLMWLSSAGALMTREDGEIHRFELGLVPREPGPLQAWLRERSAALNPG